VHMMAPKASQSDSDSEGEDYRSKVKKQMSRSSTREDTPGDIVRKKGRKHDGFEVSDDFAVKPHTEQDDIQIRNWLGEEGYDKSLLLARGKKGDVATQTDPVEEKAAIKVYAAANKQQARLQPLHDPSNLAYLAASAILEYAPSANIVTVRFGASRAAKKLNGGYELIPGAEINGRQIWANGKKNIWIMYFSDGTWVIKLGPDHDLDADVFAYVRDEAMLPHRIENPWNVAADGDGFLVDVRGAITPGRSLEKREAIVAASVKAAQIAGKAGARAEIALMDRVDREELQEFRIAALKKPLLPQPIEFHHESLYDEIGRARIRMTIIKATGLRKADLLSGTDAFVVCEVPGKGALGQTPVVNDTSEPFWDHSFEFGYTPGDSLRLSVWDFDSATKTDLLCDAVLKASHFYPSGFRGELVLKEFGIDTHASLEVMIEIVELAPDPNKVWTMSPKEQRQAAKDLKHLQHKLNAASSREKVLREKFESEKSAREAAEEAAEQARAAASSLAAHERHMRQGLLHPHPHEERKKTDSVVEEEDPEVKACRDLFEKYDADQTGQVNLEQLCEMMYELGFTDLHPEEIELMMERVEGKDDDHLDFQEFLHFLDTMQQFGGDDLAKYEVMFDHFDVNDDGTITREELEFVMVSTGKEYEQGELDRLLDEYDTSDDGRIMWDEFIQVMQKLEAGTLVQAKPTAIIDLTANGAGIGAETTKLASSDKKRIKAYLKRRGFPGENLELDQAVNQRKKVGLFSTGRYEYPLHTAAVDNLADMVWLLLLSQADKELKNSDNKTAYEAARVADGGKGTHKKVLELLTPDASGGGGGGRGGDRSHF